MNNNVECCFCGKELNENTSVLISIYPTIERDESQNLYSHKNCLQKNIINTIPLHPDIFEDDSKQQFYSEK